MNNTTLENILKLNNESFNSNIVIPPRTIQNNNVYELLQYLNEFSASFLPNEPPRQYKLFQNLEKKAFLEVDKLENNEKLEIYKYIKYIQLEFEQSFAKRTNV